MWNWGINSKLLKMIKKLVSGLLDINLRLF